MISSPLEGPAFVLGNGPGLPEDLSCLDGLFTIGVNRIFRAYRPTVLLWVDRSVYQEHAEAMEAAGSLMVCAKRLKQRRHHVGLQDFAGDEALAHERDGDWRQLCCNGNTGCCAARWALALGCSPVFLVGMGAKYIDGKTDFYGVNERHHRTAGDNGTLMLMRAELNRLLRQESDDVVPVPTGKLLREFAAMASPDAGLADRLRAALES